VVAQVRQREPQTIAERETFPDAVKERRHQDAGHIGRSDGFLRRLSLCNTDKSTRCLLTLAA
jgi:hypothetical protein